MCLPVFCISRDASALVAAAFFAILAATSFLAFVLHALSFLAFVLAATTSFLTLVLVATTSFLTFVLVATLVTTAVAALFAFVLVVSHCFLSVWGKTGLVPVGGIWRNRGNRYVISRHVFCVGD